MGFLEEFQQHNRDERDVYANNVLEEAKCNIEFRVAKAMKKEKISEEKAERILIEGFDIRPSDASDIIKRVY